MDKQQQTSSESYLKSLVYPFRTWWKGFANFWKTLLCASPLSSIREKSSAWHWKSANWQIQWFQCHPWTQAWYGQTDGTHPCWAGKAWLTGVNGFAWSMRTYRQSRSRKRWLALQWNWRIRIQIHFWLRLILCNIVYLFYQPKSIHGVDANKGAASLGCNSGLSSVRTINRHTHEFASFHDLQKDLRWTSDVQTLTKGRRGPYSVLHLDLD